MSYNYDFVCTKAATRRPQKIGKLIELRAMIGAEFWGNKEERLKTRHRRHQANRRKHGRSRKEYQDIQMENNCDPFQLVPSQALALRHQ